MILTFDERLLSHGSPFKKNFFTAPAGSIVAALPESGNIPRTGSAPLSPTLNTVTIMAMRYASRWPEYSEMTRG